MRWAFWGPVAVILYTYFGYPLWLWVRSRWRPRPVQTGACTPAISIVMVVRNEAAVLRRKLSNLRQLNYPRQLMEIVAVSDGSSDDTNKIFSELADDPQVRIVLNPEARGKAVRLNDAIAVARGEVIVFTDARQQIEAEAILRLMEKFADPAVGCASGELMLGDPQAGESAQGMGLYWQVEKKIRELESASGSVIGATGAFYAVRRHLVPPLPPGTVLDDVYIPMQVVRQGARVVFDPCARAWDLPDQGTKREFARKVRTLGGNYQLLQLAPWLLRRENPVRFEFVSHKLLRLVVPVALAVVLFSSFFLPGLVYRAALGFQLVFYALGLLALVQPGKGPLARICDPAFTFVLLNTAAAVAFTNFVIGRKALWGR